MPVDLAVNAGGLHGHANYLAEVDRIDGFIGGQQAAVGTCKSPIEPACSLGKETAGVMG